MNNPALMHPLIYYVEAARTQLGSMRPDDPDEADFWDGLTEAATHLRTAAAEGGDGNRLADCLESWLVPIDNANLPHARDMVKLAAAYIRGTVTDWFCEQHPDKPQGHDGCDGAGILAEARIPLLNNTIRLLEQRSRELIAQYGGLAESAYRQALTTDSGAGRDGWREGFPDMPNVESRLLLKSDGHPKNHWVKDVLTSDPVLIEVDRSSVAVAACKHTPESGTYWPYRVGQSIRWQPIPAPGNDTAIAGAAGEG